MSDPLNIQDMTPFQNTIEITITPSNRRRRVRHCSHCRSTTHDRRTCPGLQEQREQHAREQAEQIRLRRQEQQRIMELNKRSVEITNSTQYMVSIYWTNNDSTASEPVFKHLGVLNPWTMSNFKFYTNHRLIALPWRVNDEMIVMTLPDNRDNLLLDVLIEDLEDIERDNLPTLNIINIITPSNYKPIKSELDQWKETAFKSLYLLKELERMGAANNENLAPMIDMIQDIVIPNHTQHDKEFAGVPSTLTNIT